MSLGRRYKAVLFDKDGTLIDIHASWVRAGLSTLELLCERAGAAHRRDELLREGGYDPQRERLVEDSEWAAGTTESLVAHWIDRLGLERRLMPEMLHHMTEQAAVTVVPLADVPALFTHLERLGMLVGVATMDLAGSAARCLERLGIAHRVHFVCGCDSGFGHKPGPGMVMAFCEQVGLSPADILVVGDTPHDMHMGRSAGAATVVGVLSGASSVSALRPLADLLLRDISQLPEALA